MVVRSARALFACVAVAAASAFALREDAIVATRLTGNDDALQSVASASGRDGRPTYQAQDDDLLAWAMQPQTACTDCFLVLGIKTRGVRGFERRQIIRTAWAQPSVMRSLRIRVVFLGCEPDLSREAAPNATLAALEHEKQTFGDLLTHELGGCVDGYERLVDKTLGFLHWASVQYPSAPFVMVADDDVYVRLDRVVAILQDPSTPRTHYYAGQVPYLQEGFLAPTIRDRYHKNFLSFDAYPLSEHVPRAIGAHFLLSIDLVRFLSRNRRMLRGVGIIEDLSVGFWLRSLLGVRPVHIPAFDVAFHRICHNAFASYGELSLLAMRQIHRNLENGDALCRGFSCDRWLTPSARDAPYPTTLRPRTDVSYEWSLRMDLAPRILHVGVRIHLHELPLTIEISYAPSFSKYRALCGELDRKSEELGQRLPLMLCYDVVDRLKDYLLDHRPLSSAHLALTLSNLPPLAGSLTLSVSLWISRRVLRWRSFLESLMAVMYPDIHVFVLDEVSEPNRTALIVPDFVAVDAEELEAMPTLPFISRHLVFLSAPVQPNTMTNRPGAIFFTHDHQPLEAPHVYVPLASLVVSDSIAHSPLVLLEPSNERQTNATTSGDVAVPHCNNARAAEMLTFLSDMQVHMHCHQDIELADEAVFAFDAEVGKYTQSKFVLAFETDQVRPGCIAGTIVAAFVAGSVPIYDGDAADVSWLFNPNAFINCRHFQSLGKCAAFVEQVHESPTQYEAMRKERPVVNDTAFYDVFSWHPDVLQWRQDKSQESMATRLDALITSV